MITLCVQNAPIDISVSVPDRVQTQVSTSPIDLSVSMPDRVCAQVSTSPIDLFVYAPDQAQVQASLSSVIITVNEMATIVGGDKNYVHTQNLPLSVWTVQHNLGKYPAVTVVDSAYNEVDVEVEHVNTNVAKLYMAVAISGKAFCN